MSEKNKFCTNCGAAVDGKEFCPQCGVKQSIYDATQQAVPDGSSAPGGPSENIVHEQKRGAMEHLTIAFNVAMSNPLVFLPAILSGIIGGVIGYFSPLAIFAFLWLILQLLNLVISYVLSFASTDMSRDAYNKQPVESWCKHKLCV